MKVGIAMPMAVVAVLLAGCAHHGRGFHAPPVNPPPQDCKNQATCTIVVDPATGNMPHQVVVSAGQATVLHWDLQGGTPWKWGDNGVVFRTPGIFNCSAGGASGRRTCTKPASAPAGTYEYVLHLVYDPFVLNQ